MKMNKNRFLTVLLVLCLLSAVALCFAACGEKEAEPTTPGELTYVSKFDSGDGWPEVNKPLSWEEINKFPIKSKDMSLEDARKLCVDFFRYTKTAVWVPNDSFTYWHDWGKTREFTMEGGKLYGGVPYISVASGSIYRLMDFMDEETGVVDMKGAASNPAFFGNQCSFGAWWGWGRVINSADYNWTENMYEETGFLKLGDYEYGIPYVVGWSTGYGTDEVLGYNGPEKMYECYALLKAGDGIVYWTDAGHVVMISEDAVVVRDSNGKIKPDESYVTVIDQVQTWTFDTNEAGDNYERMNRVDGKLTFTTLYNEGKYIPFTYGEWKGTNPIEDTVTTFSYSGDSISISKLFSSTIESNYGLSDIYAFIYDSKGNEVCKIANHVETGGQMKLKFAKGAAYVWGSYEDLDPANGYTVKVVAQLATGERPTIWEGKLA
jgi:hypothetical protein